MLQLVRNCNFPLYGAHDFGERWRRGLVVIIGVLPRLAVSSAFAAALVTAAVSARAADVAPRMALKAPVAPGADWTGFYVGAHMGYATGYSKWSATEAGAAGTSLAGSLDL